MAHIHLEDNEDAVARVNAASQEYRDAIEEMGRARTIVDYAAAATRRTDAFIDFLGAVRRLNAEDRIRLGPGIVEILALPIPDPPREEE